ncbi:hypothetical protein BN1013_02458 [Candidatus Rubidus massiliensis]|nr:hypothetical protein BN1013_02458 [Candidatus Rubidus massiliensis]
MKRFTITIFCLALCLFIANPFDAFAGTVSSSDPLGLGSMLEQVEDFLYGSPKALALTLSGAMVLFWSIFTLSAQTIISFVGICFCVPFLPKFVKGIMAISGALLP